MALRDGLLRLPVPSDLVLLRVTSEEARLGLRHQLFGARSFDAPTVTVQTPAGRVDVAVAADRVTASGAGVPTAIIRTGGPLSIARVRQGITGLVDDTSISIRRPRFGLRRSQRRVVVEGQDLSWFTTYRRGRHFDIRRHHDGSVVYCQSGTEQRLDQDATPGETALALALAASGVIQTSSLLNFVTTP